MEKEKKNWLEQEISTTGLKEGKKSTRDLIHYYTKEKDTEQKAHFAFGNLMELYLINKDEFWKQVAILDESKRPFPDKNYQTVANREWKAQFYADNADKYVIDKEGDDGFETIIELEALAKHHPYYNLLFEETDYQQAFRWNDPLTGLKRYCRPDLPALSLRRIIDIKTDGDNDPKRAIKKNDYFFQAIDHIAGAENSGFMPEGERIEQYFWFFLCKKKPYFVDVIELDLDYVENVKNVYNQTHKRLKADFDTGNPENIVYRKEPMERIASPAWYE